MAGVLANHVLKVNAWVNGFASGDSELVTFNLGHVFAIMLEPNPAKRQGKSHENSIA
jgi:hypothetical protein